MRKAKVERKTLETSVAVEMNLDGSGKSEINTGIGFIDHMLTLMAFHGSFDLIVNCSGDLYVDDHHTVEDIGIALGQAFNKCLRERVGIKRYSSVYIPMDEALCRIVLDISNRPYLVFNINFERENIGSMDTQNFKEFFKAFVSEARVTLHINVLYGENDHHKIEAVFKAFSRGLKEAIQVISCNVSSSKGVL
ncbi:imidazoleglycerol-phosphate dehydratase [Clostridium tetanomorphum]|uniref:Imidazoleglycerol-phosphate dehydratase n=1 Tax=Clostridium tetanomorphum TaxID=1553 RepID=A0A923EAX8_CLOTT|nr:imidazoleglycerol-phosphate dehydratase HisB [Clostridium tetanomorphum]KAJ49819.1 imidazoleglycerol-phosphate dehydratase [Clostridium tetanomorphum DSM 665]MBC2399718.1 imidazoleglycerol-phosphate dehydratase HisB [Clostridium tetanomorphum]MBP1865121.1 imidazoleglycerol-phosphate dehydratase [Clostridium tetanomorphum]NRS84740.1 imidazoleglycerol-phosphate dehydratase [Clostridium tetanomorphum]NRZ97956.1 imidazoleglycerol-phosphate dehydratase [Clostridium tetanomorphum]